MRQASHGVAHSAAAQDGVTEEEIAAMAAVLMRRHGACALQIARHFEAEHRVIGDSARAGLWARVAACLPESGAAPTLY